MATTVQDKHAAQAGAQRLRNLSAAQWAFSEKPLSLAGALGASFIENVDALYAMARSLLLHLTSFLCPFLEEGGQLTTIMVREICVRG